MTATLDSLASDLGVTFVAEPVRPSLRYSVVTLLQRGDSYLRMLASFLARGFNAGNTQFIAIDNRFGNSLDGYEGLRAVLPKLAGKYVIYCHDDIELIGDGEEELSQILDEMTSSDPNWMVLGNCGFTTEEAGTSLVLVRHLEDPHGQPRLIERPTPVEVVDEHFIVLCRERMVLPSIDLSGFHLFAADLCVRAEMAGGRVYAIPFFLRHHSGGDQNAVLFAARSRFDRKYRRYLSGRILRAPSSTLAFGSTAKLRLAAENWKREASEKLKRVLIRLRLTPASVE